MENFWGGYAMDTAAVLDLPLAFVIFRESEPGFNGIVATNVDKQVVWNSTVSCSAGQKLQWLMKKCSLLVSLLSTF